MRAMYITQLKFLDDQNVFYEPTVTSPVKLGPSARVQAEETAVNDTSSEVVPRTPPAKNSQVCSSAPSGIGERVSAAINAPTSKIRRDNKIGKMEIEAAKYLMKTKLRLLKYLMKTKLRLPIITRITKIWLSRISIIMRMWLPRMSSTTTLKW